MKSIKSLTNVFFNREFFGFVVIGVINTFNGTLLSTLYSLMMQANIAFVAGYLTSLAVSYLLNSVFAFHEKFGWKKFIKFCISYIPNFVIQNIIVLIFLNGLGWDKVICYVIAAVIGVPVTFLCIKFFAFRK